MKKSFTLLLVLLSACISFAVEPALRIDGDAQKEMNQLTAVTGDKMRGMNMNWIADQAKKVCTFTSYSIRPITDQWQEFSLTITAQKSGRIELQIKAPHAPTPAERPWIEVTNICINGKPISDMTSTYDSPAGHPIPRPFWMPPKAVYLPTGGPNGTPAVRINHDNPLVCGIPVEGGKLTKISALVKLPAKPAPAATPAQ